jgi:hypothetical protein
VRAALDRYHTVPDLHFDAAGACKRPGWDRHRICCIFVFGLVLPLPLHLAFRHATWNADGTASRLQLLGFGRKGDRCCLEPGSSHFGPLWYSTAPHRPLRMRTMMVLLLSSLRTIQSVGFRLVLSTRALRNHGVIEPPTCSRSLRRERQTWCFLTLQESSLLWCRPIL